MPYTLLQGGSSLQIMNTAGTLSTLTLPTGITIQSTERPRFAVYGRYVVVVNSPSRPITVDPEGVVRVLTPRAPRTKPVASAAAGGTLTGTYEGVRQTFLVTDEDGNIISESAMGAPTLSVSPSSQWLLISGLDLSRDTVSATRLYRPTTGGTTLFQWIDLEGNTQTSVQDDLADASLELVAAPDLGSPPDLTLIAEFQERLWGRSRTDGDYLRFSESGRMYAWPLANSILIPRLGSSTRGITGIIPRRDALVVGRENVLYQITGTSNTDLRATKLKEGIGIEAPDSVVVYRDIAYWLAKDGVYRLDENGGLSCISDGKVRSWFNTTTHFNRSRLQYAVGSVDPVRNKYYLGLSNTGDTTLNRWIEYDIASGTWWGPHLTSAFTPTWHATILDSNSLLIPVICDSLGFVYQYQATRTDGTATGIALNVDSKYHDAQTPDITKVWGQPTLISKIQGAGTLTITPKVGALNASAGTAISADMTLGREVLRRLGTGRFAQLNFAHSTAAQDIELFGIELPFFELGSR